MPPSLQCLVVAPRLLASIASDGLLRVLTPVSRLTAGEPKLALLVTYIVGGSCVRIGSRDAVAPLRRYVRALNWPRVRLLFIGQAEGSDEACAAEGGAVGGAEGEMAGVSGEVPSCLFSLRDRELIWHIAQLLVDV